MVPQSYLFLLLFVLIQNSCSRACRPNWLTGLLAPHSLYNNYNDSCKQALPRTQTFKCYHHQIQSILSSVALSFQALWHYFFRCSILSGTLTLSVGLTALHKYQTPHSDTCTLAWYGCCQTPIALGQEVLYTFVFESFWKGSKLIDQPYLMIADKLGWDIDHFFDPLWQLWCKLHCSPVRNTSTTGKNQD